MWCQNTEFAISDQLQNPFALQEWFEQNIVMIDALTKLVCGELTDLQRRVIVSLVTTDVHARDIVEECKQ
jgi:dynein heavy chain